MSKKKEPKKRNPVAKAVKKLKSKVIPNKKKNYSPNIDQPTTKDTSYNVQDY